MEFGIISEGITDQIVLENILFGFFEDNDLPINPLQPKPGDGGNWDKVFKYCESNDFRQSLGFVDYLIVQIDIDFMRRQEVPEKYRFDPGKLSPEEVAKLMRDKLIESIGVEFYQEYSHRIIFAIAVDAIECWFLPIYFSNKLKTASKTTNCLETLNHILPRAERFSIHSKEEKYYRIISKHFRRKKDLVEFGRKNPSLGWFLTELETIAEVH
ncbi:MAG: phage tail protein [Lewinellaceae bacterium]|nr:phage tail protein [Lewinellaceae bacterium]